MLSSDKSTSGVSSGSSMFSSCIISLLPILELRGGILAASLINLDPINAYISAMIGNIIPVPFILLLISAIESFIISSADAILPKIGA